jgi:diphthamide synthase subunit DPH2
VVSFENLGADASLVAPLTPISRYEFESLGKQHHERQKLRKMTRWGQIVALFVGQLSGRRSLRDIVANLDAQQHKLYHAGVGDVSRARLARVSESQPYTLYGCLCTRLLLPELVQ